MSVTQQISSYVLGNFNADVLWELVDDTAMTVCMVGVAQVGYIDNTHQKLTVSP